MLRALRSRRVAFLTLAAFLLAQPAVGCAALCLFQKHDLGTHAMQGMDRGRQALTTSPCHTGVSGAVQRDQIQVLSPMEPGRAPLIAGAPTRWVEPVRATPTSPHQISRTVEPPPPRFV
jgi:hypothetical protein